MQLLSCAFATKNRTLWFWAIKPLADFNYKLFTRLKWPTLSSKTFHWIASSLFWKFYSFSAYMSLWPFKILFSATIKDLDTITSGICMFRSHYSYCRYLEKKIKLMSMKLFSTFCQIVSPNFPWIASGQLSWNLIKFDFSRRF